MDGDGREQDVGRTSDDDADGKAGGAPIRPEARGRDRHGGGAMATDRSDKAVTIQSRTDPDAYAGSSESGV